jgi:hypothetical protein
MLTKWLAKGYFTVIVEPGDHPFQRDFSCANSTHRVMNTPWTKTTLHDFVASSKAQ